MTQFISHPAFVTASGKSVRRLGQGTWHLAERGNRKSEIATLRRGIELGLNLIDTAEMYASGGSESLIGETIENEKREDLFLVSKCYPQNAGRSAIFKACDASLSRLGVDYLDLYLLHWRGRVPLAETAQCMEELIAQGKIRRWGVSNLDIDDMHELVSVPHGKNCVTDQVLYHVACRGPEFDLFPFLKQNSMTAMAYCPLAQFGALDRDVVRSRTLKAIAEKHGASLAQVMLAFILRDENLIPIPKSSTPTHVEDNVKALTLTLDADDLAGIEHEFPAPRHAVPLEIN